MIGPTEREIRYEAQVQRLLRRDDADTRRIVCLSAVFPSGEDLDDFVAWMTDDDPTGLHREKWRPTQQKFGLVQWNQNHARLTMTIGSGHTTFIPRYVEAKAPTGKRRNAFPSNNRELVIATAWRLVEEGQSVLVFCPQRNGVGPYADHILKLHQQDSSTPSFPPASTSPTLAPWALNGSAQITPSSNASNSASRFTTRHYQVRSDKKSSVSSTTASSR